MSGPISRRRFLGTGAATGTAGLVAAGSGGDAGAAAPRAGAAPAIASSPFHGPNQAGVLDLPATAAVLASFDVITTDRKGLADLLKTLTSQARALTAGGRVPDSGPPPPPAGSGVLGPVVTPDGLTVTLGVAASLFDERF